MATTVGFAIGALPIARGAPTDPFTAALPARDTQAPDAWKTDAGDGSVDASTGTASYALPIVVPPGRVALAPALALRYSSARPLRGGVAVGWDLDVGVIEKDPDVLAGTAYRVSWNGTSERLVYAAGDPTTAFTTTYRAERDPTFTRYVFSTLSQTWTAYTLDGRVHSFAVHNGLTRWHLSETRDRFDNRITYAYTYTTAVAGANTYGEQELSAIEYTSNPAASLAAHARVELVRGAATTCGAPVGAALDHHFGVLRAAGLRPIDTIDVKVKSAPGAAWTLRRRHRLIYDSAQLACTAGPPLRYLTRFEVTAYDPAGAATVVPPVAFSYGLPTRALTRTISAPGFGGGERGNQRGPQSMLLDLDGDGWLDRLTVGVTTRCRVSVQRGTGVGTFAATAAWIDLPSAPWYNGATPQGIESCSLSGQVVDRGISGNGGPACRTESAQVTYQFQDWDGDGLVDIVTNLHESRPGVAGGDFPWVAYGPGPASGGGGNQPPSCPVTTPAPEQDGGGFVIRVQRGLGGGAMTPVASAMLAHAPVPPPASPSVVSLASAVRPGLPAFVDVTGDGIVDAISLTQTPVTPPTIPPLPGTQPYLYVWPGTGGTEFASRQSWPLPTWSQQLQATTANSSSGWLESPGTVNVTDLDGDGLADLIVQLTSGTLAVVRNQGGSFRAAASLGTSGPVDLARTEFPPAGSVPYAITDGARGYLRQLIDVDADGLPERLYMTYGSGGVATPSTGLSVTALHGAVAIAPRLLGGEWEGLEHLVVAAGGTWRRGNDLVDVTGDGIVDAVEWSATGAATIRTDGQDGVVAPRLLASADNGRGASTRFEYAPTTDATAVDLAGRHLAPRHVVRRVVVQPGAGALAMTTTYQYADPRHGRDSWRAGPRAGFLGFATVTIDRAGSQGPASQRTIQKYSFPVGSLDGRAVLAEEWTLAHDPALGAATPVRMRAITTGQAAVLAGASSFRYPQITIERTCAAGATMATCVTTPARVRTTTATWTPYRATPTGPVLHYQETRGDVTSTGTPARHTATTFQVRSTTAEYLQEPIDVQRGDGAAVLAREVTVRDSRLAPTEYRRYQSATLYARTQVAIDGVGNQTVLVRPRQVVSGGAGTWSSYDAHRVLPAGSTNELWHTVYETRDVATGALLERRGPGWRIGLDEAGVNGAWYETERWTIDGLGRVRSRSASFDPPAGSVSTTYVQRQLETTSYLDTTVPNRVITTATQNLDTADTVIRESVHDGLGRVVQEIARRQIAGSPDAVTTYTYDEAGGLIELRAPDPRADSGATVAYRWIRDGLGRPVNVIRPDDSGEWLSYSGPSTTIVERNAAGVAGTTTRLTVDGHGDLAEVLEHGNAQPTRYGYDALGRAATVTDAEGVVTTYGHDQEGHRTSIARGARTWLFRYDLDGNLVEAETPRPGGVGPAAYTTLVEYDVLGRITRRVPAVRDLTATRRAELGIGETTYTYDTTRIGALGRRVHAFGAVDFLYDARGQLRRETRTVTPPGAAFTITQEVERTHDALGAPRQVTWDDGTAWQYAYDRRGLLTGVTWKPSQGATWIPLATFARSLAGPPRSRVAYDQQRAWTYDVLGRPTYDRIWRPSTNLTYGERNYGYDGDELVEVWGENFGLIADATYTYDAQHRLVTAAGPGAYVADLGYSPAGNVTRAAVGGALDAAARDVTYRYAAFDPQAVEALVDRGSGADVTTLTYDPQGNLRQRAGSLAPALALTWDGDDQVREAIGPGGTERYLFGEPGERVAAIGPDGIRVWFGESEARYSSAGALLSRRHHVSGDGEALARIDGPNVELQYADALANLMLGIDSGGTVDAAFLYGAFGEVVAAHGAADHRRQWNGKEADLASGLRHYGHRSYDPLLLRWVSADPRYRLLADAAAAMPQRANLYAFSLNNPLRWVDPDGLETTPGAACAPPKDCEVDAPREPMPWDTDPALDPDSVFAPHEEDGGGVCEVEEGSALGKLVRETFDAVIAAGAGGAATTTAPPPSGRAEPFDLDDGIWGLSSYPPVMHPMTYQLLLPRTDGSSSTAPTSTAPAGDATAYPPPASEVIRRRPDPGSRSAPATKPAPESRPRAPLALPGQLIMRPYDLRSDY